MKVKKRILSGLLSMAISALLLSCAQINASAQEAANLGGKTAFRYEHDPRLNEKAMEDIIVNPDAVYGFSPNPDSKRLGPYATADWTDPVQVEEWRQERIAYYADFDEMYLLWEAMESQGCEIEEIARAVSNKRNEIRIASYDNDPEGLEKLKKSNLDSYGNEFGPTPESLFEKYGNWETVLLKSFSSNAGMDACLGLYDDQFEHYILLDAYHPINAVYYTVVAGDNLSKLAVIYYGDATLWRKIYEANTDIIAKPSLIYVGQELFISLD